MRWHLLTACALLSTAERGTLLTVLVCSFVFSFMTYLQGELVGDEKMLLVSAPVLKEYNRAQEELATKVRARIPHAVRMRMRACTRLRAPC